MSGSTGQGLPGPGKPDLLLSTGPAAAVRARLDRPGWRCICRTAVTGTSRIRKFRIVQKEGKREVTRDIAHYTLDVIFPVGYRIKSAQGTRFRQWASARLKEHLVGGYTLNEERLRGKLEHIRQLERTLTRFQQNLIDQAGLDEARGYQEL
ncbi:MAG: RhuM family protein [Acidiferrobacterales bacterium]